jgi:hypothetical protein
MHLSRYPENADPRAYSRASSRRNTCALLLAAELIPPVRFVTGVCGDLEGGVMSARTAASPLGQAGWLTGALRNAVRSTVSHPQPPPADVSRRHRSSQLRQRGTGRDRRTLVSISPEKWPRVRSRPTRHRPRFATRWRYFDRHDSVNLNNGEKVRSDVHTNTIEGCFSFLKGGIHGTLSSQKTEKQTQ